MNQKPSEAGWFYHAPAKKVENPEPVGAPPASQVPGLGDIAVLPPEVPKEMVFRDTDSKYIRLAKMGGRKDLLVIRPNSGTKREAKSYPRSDWFYLEDNAQQEKAKENLEQEPWKFLLPDYMVHQPMEGAALLQDAQTGGIPCHKQDSVPVDPTPRVTGRQPPVAHTRQATTRKEDVKSPRQSPRKQEEPTSMSKLLAYSYQREWHEKHKAQENNKLAKNQKPPLAKSPTMPNKSKAKTSVNNNKTNSSRYGRP